MERNSHNRTHIFFTGKKSSSGNALLRAIEYGWCFSRYSHINPHPKSFALSFGFISIQLGVILTVSVRANQLKNKLAYIREM